MRAREIVRKLAWLTELKWLIGSGDFTEGEFRDFWSTLRSPERESVRWCHRKGVTEWMNPTFRDYTERIDEIQWDW